jgi:hypothetical protein
MTLLPRIRRVAVAGAMAISAFAAAPLMAQERFVPAAPEPGSDIPAATIKFGMRP